MPKGIWNRPRPTLEERFWSKVERRSDDECWLWLSAMNAQGYGAIWRGKAMPNYPAHRMALELAGKPRVGNSIALHSCDNPSCVNPNHLRWGTHKENAAEMHERGRAYDRRGDRHPLAKLTREQALEIRASREKLEILAARYGVSISRISMIRNGKSWTNLEEAKRDAA